MGDGNADGHAVAADAGGERSLEIRGLEEDLFAVEAEVPVADQGSGQQARLAEDLEAVADAQHQSAVVGETAHGLHHRAEAGDGTAPEGVAVAEAAGNDDRIHLTEVGVLVPDQLGLGSQHAQGVDAVLIAVGGRELEDGHSHGRSGGHGSHSTISRR
jgi:hypothetical protein